MPKIKTKIFYSRNGIKYYKMENVDKIPPKNPRVDSKVRIHALDQIQQNNKHSHYSYETKKYESKLGFYYYKREYHNSIKVEKKCTIKFFDIQLGSTEYHFEYPIDYTRNGETQKINIEMRPWDILPGYTGMPDNMIDALVKEANNFIDICEPYNKEIRKEIMTDLFGYPDGPKIQPNNIKILAHGFDLKTSFRKDKEK